MHTFSNMFRNMHADRENKPLPGRQPSEIYADLCSMTALMYPVRCSYVLANCVSSVWNPYSLDNR